ncbi:MAG: discoidin domain-containing protein [Phycisphaerae bacterium]|jgi:hypothetical protein
MSWRFIVVLAGLSACVGCTGQIYHDGRGQASALSSRSTWRASGDLRSPALAIDGDTSTMALSPSTEGKGTLTIDLGKPCVFNTIIIEHGSNEFGFARRTAVSTSTDGVNFTQRYSAPGTRRVTILCPSTPMLARYVRIQAAVPGDQPWSVAEVFLQ